MTVIAMTREMGTLGKEVARLVAERLDLAVVHHEIIESRNGTGAPLQPSHVARFLESTPEEQAAWATPHAEDGYLTPSQILALAARGQVLIRGWGAARLLNGLPHVLTVRVCAPMEARVAEMSRRLGVSERTARREIERSDAAHSRSVLAFFAEDWRSPLNYDVVLNTGHLAVERCADILVDAAAGLAAPRPGEDEDALSDRLLAARISEALHGPGPLRDRAAHVEGAVEHGQVRLFGAVTDGTAAQEIERMVRTLPGVTAVRNEIARIGRYADG